MNGEKDDLNAIKKYTMQIDLPKSESPSQSKTKVSSSDGCRY